MAMPTAPIDSFRKHPRYVRASDVPSDALIQSIKTEGLLRPIAVAKRADNQFVVVNGWLRVQALKRLGVATVPYKLTAEPAIIPDESL